MVSTIAESRRTGPSIPDVLTFNGGYVDTAASWRSRGCSRRMSPATFVTIGASLAHGSSGAVAKLLALPVFCIVVMAVRFLSGHLSRSSDCALTGLLALKVLLLAAGAAMALALGPFRNGDALPAIVTGLTLVTAMAIQNAVHRIHCSRSPPTTLTTGSTTQVMIDLADLRERICRRSSVQQPGAARRASPGRSASLLWALATRRVSAQTSRRRGWAPAVGHHPWRAPGATTPRRASGRA